MEKWLLSERDICTKYITPAIQQAGWQQSQFREEVQLTDGRVMVRREVGLLGRRIQTPNVGPNARDYVLYARPNLPVAVVEAKQNKYPLERACMQPWRMRNSSMRHSR